MSGQLSIDFSAPSSSLAEARRARNAGIARAIEAAEARVPKWSDVAYQFIEQYARKHALFTPEDLVDAAKAWGLSSPASEKAWGGPFRRAVNAGLIERSDVPYQRRKGHGTESRMWRSIR